LTDKASSVIQRGLTLAREAARPACPERTK